MLFLLKALRLGNQLLVHALAVEQGQPLSLDLNVQDYINNENFSDIDNLYRNIDQLVELFSKNIMSKLLPSIEDIRTPPSSNSSSSQNQSTPLSPSGYQPPDYDPLRIGPPRTGTPYPSRPPLGGGIGGDDLLAGPGGGFGFLPGFGGGGVYGGPAYGGLVGPNHPGFGIRNPHAPQFPLGSYPPGARFDPYGPPGVRPNPDNDHLPPPGRDYSDDMFM